MKRLAVVLLYFGILLPGKPWAQTNLPSYPEVIKEFYTNYSYLPEKEHDEINFVKKKRGWYVQIVDRVNDDSIKNEQLFRDINETGYSTLTGFGLGLPDEDVVTKIGEHLRVEGPIAYGYERCRYFGYDEWPADMIKDFGNNIPANDTLVEGLARAYSNYADRFLGHGFAGHQVNDDPLTKKLPRNE